MQVAKMLDMAIKAIDKNYAEQKKQIINKVFRELEYIRDSVENSNIKSEVNGAVSRIKEELNKLR